MKTNLLFYNGKLDFEAHPKTVVWSGLIGFDGLCQLSEFCR